MKFWQSISWVEAEQLAQIAILAESMGFHGVTNSEHLFLTKKTDSNYPYTKDGKMNHELDYAYADVWTSFAAMAAVTRTLRFSSSVYLLPLRNPVDVAKQAATCALISGDRVTVGFGVGWQKEEFDVMGVDFHTRGKRTDEMIEVMRKLWGGAVVSHHGDFFNFDQIQMRPVPNKPIPFYCGGKSPAALKRAAYLCEGFIGPPHTVAEVPALVAELNRLRESAGRSHLPFEIILPITPLSDRTAANFRRLQDMGVTGATIPPFDAGGFDRNQTSGLGRTSTIDEKKRKMEHWAETVVRHFT